MSTDCCYFYLVRHGESVANADNVNQGHFDSPLTRKGEVQARELAVGLQAIDFKDIHSSDLTRARRTAEIINTKGLPIITSPLLRERSFGLLEGLPKSVYLSTIKEGLKQFDLLPETEKWTYKIHCEVETDQEVLDRFTQYLNEIACSCNGKNILIVTHRGPTRLLLSSLDEIPYQNPEGARALLNTGYIKLKYHNNRFSVVETVGIREV
jgi:broad specificity phosphatase PhoE